LRGIFGSKRDEWTGEWRKLHNEELNDMYSSSNMIRMIQWIRMRLAEHVSRIREKRGAYRILVRKSEGKETILKTQTWMRG
jgi:hypothetical protein